MTGSALTKGALEFAIVVHFDNGSRGAVRLQDGRTLPFSYADGRHVSRGGPLQWSEGEDAYIGISWPITGSVIMVELSARRIIRWTWPGPLLERDQRYLARPIYSQHVRFPGLHCLVDITTLPFGTAEDLVSGPVYDFPPEAVYVGHHADDFLKRASGPYAYAVFGWGTGSGGQSRLVSMIASM